MTAALACGYTHIDTASVYKNEEDIADALEEFAARRDGDGAAPLDASPSSDPCTASEAGAYTRPLISSTCAEFGYLDTETTQRFPQKVLTLNRKVNECKPLLRGLHHQQALTLRDGHRPRPHRRAVH